MTAGEPLLVGAPGLLDNDIAADGTTLIAEIAVDAEHGTLQLNATDRSATPRRRLRRHRHVQLRRHRYTGRAERVRRPGTTAGAVRRQRTACESERAPG